MLLPAVPGTPSKQHAVGSISRQERIIFHPLVSVGNISLKNTPDFSCSCGITHFRHVPFSNSHLLHFRKFLSFSPSPFSPSPSPLRPPSHSVFLSFSLSFFSIQHLIQETNQHLPGEKGSFSDWRVAFLSFTIIL